MAEKIADVLDAARSLANGGEFIKGDLKVKAYPNNKVRIFIVPGGDGLNICIAGDVHSDDTKAGAKAVQTSLITQGAMDAALKAVVQLAGDSVKPPAQIAAPSS